jgi:hypothetical protein
VNATTYERREALKRVRTCMRKLQEAYSELTGMQELIAASCLTSAIDSAKRAEANLLQRIASLRDRRGAASPQVPA